MNLKKPSIYIVIVGIVALAFFLSKIFSGSIILPQTFSLGPAIIHYYGLVMALAVFSGFFLALNRAPKHQISEKQAEDIMFWVILSGFIGARFYHVLTAWDYYIQNPTEILKVWHGGLAIYGAITGGLLAVVILKKIFNLQSSILNLLDWLAPSVLLGQIIGRFGNFFNYELFGYPTNLPWKMFVPLQYRPEAYLNSSFFHPVFLYEASGNLIILIFLLYLGSKIRKPSIEEKNSTPGPPRASAGTLFFSYLLLYNVLRFSIEFLKIDSQFIGPFRLNVIAGFILAIISAAAIYQLNKVQWKNTTNTFQ